MTNFSIFQEWLPALWERGRNLSSFFQDKTPHYEAMEISDLCRRLITSHGDYANLLMAELIIRKYEQLDEAQRKGFFLELLEHYELDLEQLQAALTDYTQEQNYRHFKQLMEQAEPKRQELLRRLNFASNGTPQLVKMREQLLALLKDAPQLKRLDFDFQHLFRSWFNRGFLLMRPIDWSTPAHILEKVISYESVHEIASWDELRQRLEPQDRRCYAFFHPAMQDDPLIFVEVALTEGLSDSIEQLLDTEREQITQDKANTATFYSISNCHRGLAGVSFGSFLIKQVAQHLKQEIPNLNQFATLSPIPGFCQWLKESGQHEYLSQFYVAHNSKQETAELKEQGMALLAEYFLIAKNDQQHAYDPVARFHLTNGAILKRLNWGANLSAKGIEQSLGCMVNYLYELDQLEANHEAYIEHHEIIVDSTIKQLLKPE